MELLNGIVKLLEFVKTIFKIYKIILIIFSMPYEYLSITSSVFVVLGYLPEIYFVIINKKSNITNIPIWIIWLLSSGLGIIYCGLIQNYLIMLNYLLNFFLCLLTFFLNMFFLYYYKNDEISMGELSMDEISMNEKEEICDIV